MPRVSVPESPHDLPHLASYRCGQERKGSRRQARGGIANHDRNRRLRRPQISPDDAVVECGGVKVFVDPDSQPLLTGLRVDFVESLEGSGFSFDNPNAASKCSCGKSFG
jgi:iron-sulfur cluster assembly accessory protein